MNACANSQFVSISKTIQDYTEFLGKVDSIVLNDPEIKSLDSSIEWYKDKVSRLQRKSDNYGQRLESFKHNCEAIQGTRKELEAKLKSIRLENMRLEFKAKQQKLREQSSSVLKTGLLNSCNDSRMLRSKCSSIYTNLSPAFEILLSSEDLETANVYTERVSNLKQDITSARRKIQNINKDEGIHRKRPLEMSEFFQQCFNSVFNQLLSAQEIESNRDMKLYLLIKQESGSPRHSRNTDEFRQFMRSNKGYSPRSDTTVSFDALEKKMKKIDREMVWSI
jgi:chromosome segregation ATPase